MSSGDRRDVELFRLTCLGLALAVPFLVIGGCLWKVQVLDQERHEGRFMRQSVRRVRLPGVRGMVYDRNGVCLAGNRPSFCLGIHVEELRRPGDWGNTVDEVDRTVQRLAKVLRRERTLSRAAVARHINQRLPLPLIVWRDLSPEEIVRWEHARPRFRGVEIEVESVRTYPRGGLAPHLVGYVQRYSAEERDAGEPDGLRNYYIPEMEGLCGLERALNTTLAGAAGGELIQVDAAGYRVRNRDESDRALVGRPPEPGQSVVLTIDARIQSIATNILHGVYGAVVVLDCRNGDVLAMASSPTYDLSRFSPRIPAGEFARLTGDPGRPFLNRAVSARYAAGSVFKPVVAIAALENRRASPDTRFDCPGYFELGGVRFECWNFRGHGTLDMRKAIEQSCNSYFCQLGLKCGYERIFHMAEALGFGHRTGVGLREEIGGLLPDDRWKRQRFGESWRQGDTCNVSIGQGPLVVTPLQMAVLAATLANGGYVYRPRLVLERTGAVPDPYGRTVEPHPLDPPREGELVNTMGWDAETLATVRGGMYDVVNARNATGSRAAVEGVAVAGKTGTAEYGLSSDRQKYAWMIAFAPFEMPRYAVALVIEDALAGGRDAAPKIGELLREVFSLPDAARGDGSGGPT